MLNDIRRVQQQLGYDFYEDAQWAPVDSDPRSLATRRAARRQRRNYQPVPATRNRAEEQRVKQDLRRLALAQEIVRQTIRHYPFGVVYVPLRPAPLAPRQPGQSKQAYRKMQQAHDRALTEWKAHYDR